MKPILNSFEFFLPLKRFIILLIIIYHLIGADAKLQTPHVLFPPLRVIYPASPHEAPQEFLITQFPLISPVTATAWLRRKEQSLKTPVLYYFQLVASTLAATTPVNTEEVKTLQLPMPENPEILKSPPSIWHFPANPRYGYLA